MGAVSHRVGVRVAVALLTGISWAAGTLRAGAQGSFDLFYVGASTPIADETGTNLLRGNAHMTGCVVQIIQVTDTNNPYAVPFNPDATVNTDILLLNSNAVTTIGALVSPALERPGVFSYVASKPASGTKIFVRAFNAPTIFDASYYADSVLFTASSDKDFDAVIVSTTNALDMTDSEGDGLIDRWEKFLGSNPFSSDTDGDGMSDGDEKRAGTDVLDGSSYLAVATVQLSGEDAVIEWASVPGQTYTFEYTDDILGGEEDFTGIGSEFTATGTVSQVTLVDALQGVSCRQFRVVVSEKP